MLSLSGKKRGRDGKGRRERRKKGEGEKTDFKKRGHFSKGLGSSKINKGKYGGIVSVIQHSGGRFKRIMSSRPS